MVKSVPLKELCQCEITDGTHKTPTYADEGYIFLSSKNVTTGKIDWDDVMYIPQSLHEELYKRLAPQKNDILLAKNGTTGIAALVDRDEVFDIYVSLALIRPDQSKVLPQYLLYAINSPATNRFFNSNLKGIGVPNLHLTHIRETPIAVPPISIQTNIVRKLSVVDAIISLRRKQIIKLDQLIKSQFIEMFGDPIINPKKLPLEKLSGLSELITKGASPKWQGYQYTNDTSQTMFITSENVREKSLDISIPKYIEDGFNNKQSRSILKKGDFLINIVGASIGRAARFDLDVKANINQAVALVRVKENMVLSDYMLFYLNSPKALAMYDAMKSDVARANLSLQDIGNLEILVPAIAEQKRFSELMQQADKSKFAIQQSIDKLETLKKSLMQEYFG